MTPRPQPSRRYPWGRPHRPSWLSRRNFVPKSFLVGGFGTKFELVGRMEVVS